MRKLTNKEFISRAIKAHGNEYDYSLVEYVNGRTNVNIICEKHGIFSQNPRHHTEKKSKCPKCANEQLSIKFSMGIEVFIKKATKKHDNKYDYSKVIYKNSSTEIEIFCPIHGKFSQTPSLHLKTYGCTKCKKSKGEETIINFLNKKNVQFETQKKFSDCKYLCMLAYDFYLPKYNLLIEFDGIQHYKPINFFGGKEGLKLRKIRDKIKNNFAVENKIYLLRLPYSLLEYNELIPTLKHTLKL